ncbi:hypothetical protein [Acaryochloris sp. IP29b_bin.148]|uniref:hypothetical protein n=1 Tax=Acaryochloris sp. IP29b_bin.148 TaxID=2969218 RepID=UPI00260A0CCD|nr:hypothetical protein [Acaryochloris sp. IP29b_bin.148]
MAKGPLLQEVWDSLSDERKKRIQTCTDELDAELSDIAGVEKDGKANTASEHNP